MPQVTPLAGRLVDRSSARDFTGGEAAIIDLPMVARAVEIPADVIFLPNVCVCSGLDEYGVLAVVTLRKVGARESCGGVVPVE